MYDPGREEMRVIKKLTKHGNSRALVIERPVLELLKIKDDTPLEVSTDGNVLIIAPVRRRKRQKEFRAALESANRRYGRMLKRLAGKHVEAEDDRRRGRGR